MVIIVGAGAAGLAVGRELRRNGIAYRILERAEVGNTWRRHYGRLRLHTLKQVSGLPGRPMPADYPAFPSAAQVHAYLRDYARAERLAVEEGVEVCRAERAPGGWRLSTSAGLVEARALVMATGIWSAPFTPPIAGRADFAGPIVHAADYRNPQPFQGRRVLVVGAGNSGSEIAAELAAAGVETSIAVRGGVAFVPRPRSATAMHFAAWLFRTLPRPLGDALLRRARADFAHLGLPRPEPLIDAYPVVGFELPEAVAAGRVHVRPALAALTPGCARFADGSTEPYGAVILATGYRPALGPVAHLVQFTPDGRPIVDQGSRAAGAPGLYCVGYSYPATAGWLQSIGGVARRAAAAIAADRKPSDQV